MVVVLETKVIELHAAIGPVGINTPGTDAAAAAAAVV
jgi:hypothetical protein